MNEKLKQYEGFIQFLENVFPTPFEVVLFDTQDKCEIVEQSNWANDSMNEMKNYVRNLIQDKELTKKDYLLNQVMIIEKERMLKISCYFIKDNEEVIGVLCINMECSLFMKVQSLMNSLLVFNSSVNVEEVNVNWDEIQLEDITSFTCEYNVEPSRMTLSERMELLLDLYDAGYFKLKGSVARVAEELSISEKSVYRNLSQIKKNRN